MDIKAILKQYAFFFVTGGVVLAFLVVGWVAIGSIGEANAEKESDIERTVRQAEQLVRRRERPNDIWIKSVESHGRKIQDVLQTLLNRIGENTASWRNEYNRLVAMNETDYSTTYRNYRDRLLGKGLSIPFKMGPPTDREDGDGGYEPGMDMGGFDDPFGMGDPMGGMDVGGGKQPETADKGLVFWNWTRTPSREDQIVSAEELTAMSKILETLKGQYPGVRRMIFLNTYPGAPGQVVERTNDRGQSYMERARIVPAVDIDLSTFSEMAVKEPATARREIAKALEDRNFVAFHKIGVHLALEVRVDALEEVLQALIHESGLMLSIEDIRMQRVVSPFGRAREAMNPGESVVRLYVKGHAYRYLNRESLVSFLAIKARTARGEEGGDGMMGPGMMGSDPFGPPM